MDRRGGNRPPSARRDGGGSGGPGPRVVAALVARTGGVAGGRCERGIELLPGHLLRQELRRGQLPGWHLPALPEISHPARQHRCRPGQRPRRGPRDDGLADRPRQRGHQPGAVGPRRTAALGPLQRRRHAAARPGRVDGRRPAALARALIRGAGGGVGPEIPAGQAVLHGGRGAAGAGRHRLFAGRIAAGFFGGVPRLLVLPAQPSRVLQPVLRAVDSVRLGGDRPDRSVAAGGGLDGGAGPHQLDRAEQRQHPGSVRVAGLPQSHRPALPAADAPPRAVPLPAPADGRRGRPDLLPAGGPGAAALLRHGPPFRRRPRGRAFAAIPDRPAHRPVRRHLLPATGSPRAPPRARRELPGPLRRPARLEQRQAPVARPALRGPDPEHPDARRRAFRWVSSGLGPDAAAGRHGRPPGHRAFDRALRSPPGRRRIRAPAMPAPVLAAALDARPARRRGHRRRDARPLSAPDVRAGARPASPRSSPIIPAP